MYFQGEPPTEIEPSKSPGDGLQAGSSEQGSQRTQPLQPRSSSPAGPGPPPANFIPGLACLACLSRHISGGGCEISPLSSYNKAEQGHAPMNTKKRKRKKLVLVESEAEVRLQNESFFQKSPFYTFLQHMHSV